MNLKLDKKEVQFILDVLTQSPLRYVDTAPIMNKVITQIKEQESKEQENIETK